MDQFDDKFVIDYVNDIIDEINHPFHSPEIKRKIVLLLISKLGGLEYETRIDE